MKNLTFHIVGLTHNDVKGHEVEYAKEAEGRTICLVPDDANTFDMLAVKAYDKQQLIGYVSALEGEDVRALIIARKERNLRTRCIGCNSKNEGDKAGLQLMVRALSDVSDEEMEQARREIYDDKIYDDWQYSGPVLPIEQLTRFSDCTMMLEGVINSIRIRSLKALRIKVLLHPITPLLHPIKPLLRQRTVLLMQKLRRCCARSLPIAFLRQESGSVVSSKSSAAIIPAK